MNSELIYLLLFGLMMFACCYHMMRMMMKGGEHAEHSDKPLADVEKAEVLVRPNRPPKDAQESTVTGYD
jgi:hypothetical protein